MSDSDTACARCRLPFPGWDDQQAVYWEALPPDGVEIICRAAGDRR